MDGYLVPPYAAVLDRHWHKTWPPDVRAQWKRGHYKRTEEQEEGVTEVWWWVRH